MFTLHIKKGLQKLGGSIFDKYIWATALVILSLILLVPLLTYFLTGKKEYISPIHFGLAFALGLLQIAVVNTFRRELKGYWKSLRRSFETLIYNLASIKKPSDLVRVRKLKENILEPWHRERDFQEVAKGVDILVDNILDILEVNIYKEDLLRKLTTTLEVEKLSRILVLNLLRNFNLLGAAFYLKSPRGEVIELRENRGFKNVEPFLDETYTQKLLALDRKLFEEPINWEVSHGILNEVPQSLLVYPLKVRENVLLGVLFLAVSPTISKERRRILKKLLLDIHTPISLIFENALEHQKSVLLASFDPLTGAYNRREGYRLLQKKLQRAAAEERNLCILVLDLDNFKKINDTYGHEVGDLVLKEFVRAINRSIRQDEDIVIRWGGEEFVVVLDNIPPQKVYEVAERIRQNIANTPIKLDDNTIIHITASVGVACTETEKNYSLEELFSIADKRLYKAKREGKNKVVVN